MSQPTDDHKEDMGISTDNNEYVSGPSGSGGAHADRAPAGGAHAGRAQAGGSDNDTSSDEELPNTWPPKTIPDDHPKVKVKLAKQSRKKQKYIDFFKKSLTSQGMRKVHKMHRQVKGKAIVINNVNFEYRVSEQATGQLPQRPDDKQLADPKLKREDIERDKIALEGLGQLPDLDDLQLEDPNLERDGNDKDEKALEQLLTQLGYEYDPEQDLKRDMKTEDMKSFLYEKSTNNYTGYDSVIVVLMSHGESRHVNGTDWGKLEVDGVVDDFSINRTLCGKPKIFLIAACNGDKEDTGYLESDLESETLESDHVEPEPETIPTCSVRFFAWSSPPGYKSIRDPYFGTWFIQAVVWVFAHYAYKMPLRDLMDNVQDLIQKCQLKNDKGKVTKQVVNIEHTFGSKKLYFFPGLSKQEDGQFDNVKSKNKRLRVTGGVVV